MAEPCDRCGARADVGCKHRPAEGAPPPAIRDPKVKKIKRNWDGQGWNFHRRKRDAS